jgi:hypothetical protein
VAKVLYGGLAEDIITTPRAVMMDWTGWSSPIGAARQMEREDSSGPSPAGLCHRSEPCGIPLSIKGGPSHHRQERHKRRRQKHRPKGKVLVEKLGFKERSVETYKIYIL